MLIAFVVLGWLTWWEAARIEGARYTVAHGWGMGLAIGILASLGLTAVWVVTVLATRRTAALRVRAQLPLAVILVVSWGFCLRSTMPSSSAAGPYVITTGIGVAEIAYTATYAAYFAVLLVLGAVRIRRRAGRPPVAAAAPR